MAITALRVSARRFRRAVQADEEVALSSEIIADATHAIMSEATFRSLPDYSMSLPSGAFAGKRWRRFCPNPGCGWDGPGDWMLGEFVDKGDPKYMGIIWREIIIL